MSRSRHAVLLVLAVVAVAAGVGSIAVGRDAPAAAFAGRSFAAAGLELAAGWGLVLAGVVVALRRRTTVGFLLAAAGIAWFAAEWANPGVGSALVFTAGLVVPAACAPLVAHAVLASSRGIASRVERAGVAIGYLAAAGVGGLAPTLTFDPARAGCSACPRNLLFVHGAAGAHVWLERWGLRVACVAVVILAALLARRAVASASLGTRLVIVPGCAYLIAVVVQLWHDSGTDSPVIGLWRVEGVALVGLAAAIGWRLLRAAQARRSLARLAVDLASAPGVRDRLAVALGDPHLQILYRWSGADGLVDANGEEATVAPVAGRAVTRLERAGRELAAIVHRASLLDDPGLVEDVVAAVRLELENEGHEADLRAQLRTLQASRARIVASGDEARRQLERDLHDGAQQRFIGISLALRLLRTGGTPTPALHRRLDAADAELRATLADLRDVAHGIFPAVLEDEGLLAALEQLAAASPVDVTLGDVASERFDPAVESAAYFVVSETVKQAAAEARVAAQRAGAELVVEVQIDAAAGGRRVDLEDRVGALNGTVRIDGGRVLAELPCG